MEDDSQICPEGLLIDLFREWLYPIRRPVPDHKNIYE